MSEQPNLLETFPGFDQVIQSLGPPITPEDLDRHIRIQEFNLKSYQLRICLDAWKEQQDQDRTTRKYYAKWLLIVVYIQIAIINLFFILIGVGVLNIQEWTANTFIVSVFAEISAMVLIVINYLFPKGQKSSSTLFEIFRGGGLR